MGSRTSLLEKKRWIDLLSLTEKHCKMKQKGIGIVDQVGSRYLQIMLPVPLLTCVTSTHWKYGMSSLMQTEQGVLQLSLVPKVDTFRYYCCMSCCRRESWTIFSTYTCWQHLLGITRQQSRDHSVLSDVYTNSMNQRLSDVCEDSRRLYTKVHIHLKHHLIL